MPDQRERQQLLEFLRRNRLRVTAERLELFEEVFSQHGHIDADELLAGLRARGAKISRATVYRNLDLLVRCGLVRRHRLAGERWVYEHVHTGQRHDHLVCRDCGRVVEFVSPGITALLGEICRAHGFQMAGNQLQIAGRCRECAAAEPRAPLEAAARA